MAIKAGRNGLGWFEQPDCLGLNPGSASCQLREFRQVAPQLQPQFIHPQIGDDHRIFLLRIR